MLKEGSLLHMNNKEMLKLNNISSITISISNTTTISRQGLLGLWYAGAAPIIHLLLLLLFFIIITLLLVALVVYYYNYSIPTKIINKKKKNTITPTTTTSSYDETCWTISPNTTHHHHHHDTSDVNETMPLPQDDTTLLEEADAKYAQELQFQEALLASSSSSILASQTSTSRTHNKERPSSLSSLLQNNNNNIQHQMCRICFEKQEYWQMFTNTTCSHSFCYDCTRKHATTKILEKISTITCPELNCKSTLDFNSLRLIVPKHVLIKWDQVLCESTILESHKFYCPFADCSALLINDDSTITQNNCPVCNRSICAVCHVPWHSEFTCKEFGKLNMTNKKGKKDYEKLAMALAKKNKWKKCPNCKFFVEKAEGCVHITCRCKYEFCYDCGNKWTSNHGGCKPRS